MTFSDATKIIVMGSRRFRVVTVDLKDLPYKPNPRKRRDGFGDIRSVFRVDMND